MCIVLSRLEFNTSSLYMLQKRANACLTIPRKEGVDDSWLRETFPALVSSIFRTAWAVAPGTQSLSWYSCHPRINMVNMNLYTSTHTPIRDCTHTLTHTRCPPHATNSPPSKEYQQGAYEFVLPPITVWLIIGITSPIFNNFMMLGNWRGGGG